MTKLTDLQQTADAWSDRHRQGMELAAVHAETLRRVADRACEDPTSIHALSATEANAVVVAVLAVTSAQYRDDFQRMFRSEQAQRN